MHIHTYMHTCMRTHLICVTFQKQFILLYSNRLGTTKVKFSWVHVTLYVYSFFVYKLLIINSCASVLITNPTAMMDSCLANWGAQVLMKVHRVQKVRSRICCVLDSEAELDVCLIILGLKYTIPFTGLLQSNEYHNWQLLLMLLVLSIMVDVNVQT